MWTKLKIVTAGYSQKYVTQIYRALHGDAMLVPIRIGTNMAGENQQKHLPLSFATKSVNLLSRKS